MDHTAHTTVAQANDDQDLPASINSDEAPAARPAPLLRFSDLRISRRALARARATADSESSANATGIIVNPAALTGTRIVYSAGPATQTPSPPLVRRGGPGARALRMPLDLITMRDLPLVNDRDPTDWYDRDEEDGEEDGEDDEDALDTHPSSAPAEEIPGIGPSSGIPLHPARHREQRGVTNQSAWKPPQVEGMNDWLVAEEQAKEAGGVPCVRHDVVVPEYPALTPRMPSASAFGRNELFDVTTFGGLTPAATTGDLGVDFERDFAAWINPLATGSSSL